MKITEIKSFPLFTDSGNFLFVKVETDEGIYGVGEAVRMQWIRSIEQAVAHLEGWLVGHDPLSTEALWQLMARGCYPPMSKVVYSAISAIDMALWDIKGKTLNLPVYKLLGGPVRDKVVCYPHNGGRTMDEFLEDCRRTVAEGWRFVRFGVSGSTEPGVFEPSSTIRHTAKRVEQVRKTVGDDIEICLDVHTKMDTPMTIRLARELEPYNLFFLEDPLRSENPASLRTLARHTSIPIAAGEQWASKWGFREAIEEELISYARMDLGIVGGITEAMKITHWCETHYIDIAPHNPNGPVATAASAHLCLASSNVGVQEISIVPGTFLTDVFPVQAPFEHGHLLKTDRPGLGMEFNEQAARKYTQGDSARPPAITRRRDGALNNG